AHLLHDALGRPVELDGDAGLGVVQAVERHDARVVRAGRAVPRDALVGALLGDLRVELALDAPEHRPPVRVRRAELADPLHALHVAGELLELRPLVVGGADGDVDVDRLGDGAHGATSCGCGRYASTLGGVALARAPNGSRRADRPPRGPGCGHSSGLDGSPDAGPAALPPDPSESSCIASAPTTPSSSRRKRKARAYGLSSTRSRTSTQSICSRIARATGSRREKSQ